MPSTNEILREAKRLNQLIPVFKIGCFVARVVVRMRFGERLRVAVTKSALKLL